MKSYIKTILALVMAFLATVSQAQTNTDQPSRLQTFVASALSSSNLTGAVYGTYFNDNHKIGGGYMLLYNVGDYVSAGLGSDYAGEWRMFSGTVTVHYKFTVITDKLDLTLYGVGAAGTSVGGAGTDNGTLATGEGGGFHWNYQITPAWSAGLGAGWITRQNCGTYSGGSEMITGSVGWKF